MDFESGYRTLQSPQTHRVRGIELDLTWRANERMEWIASGALMDNKLSEANDESLSASMVADNTLGMLGRFSFYESWAYYLGVNYVSDRSIDTAGEAKLGNYTLVDMTLEKTLGRHTDKWQTRLITKNVLNEYHPSVATPGIRVTPTPGRQALLKITYEFQK